MSVGLKGGISHFDETNENQSVNFCHSEFILPSY